MIIKQIKNKVYDYKVYFVLQATREELDSWLKKRRPNIGLTENYQGVTYMDKDFLVLYIADFKDYVILHECIHIVQYILDQKGVGSGYQQTESVAYNTDWLYRSVMRTLYKTGKSNKYKEYPV